MAASAWLFKLPDKQENPARSQQLGELILHYPRSDAVD
jgi:hypothetical protein